MHKRTLTAAAVTALAVPALLTACTAKDKGGDGAIAVTSTDKSCELSSATTETGQVTFNVTNNGNKITEFYVYGNNNRVLGEVENIGPGLTGKLAVEIVEPGTYQAACKPGMVGEGIRKELTVTGASKEKSQVPASVEAAKARYLDYVRGQVTGLQDQTQKFVAAVKSGDLQAARDQFGLTRTFWERIEPVAESFPDLDPAVDMRWDDTEDGKTEFTGFHRIERFLWPPQADEIGDQPGQISPKDAENAKATDNQAAIDKIADKLQADVNTLATEVDKPDFEFGTQSFVKGPQQLVDEIAKTKVGGEEDRYSHTDLWDFAANIDGAQTLISEMEQIITAKNPSLMNRINDQFGAVKALLAKYQSGEGYISYAEVPEDQRKALSDAIDALSATLSQVPGTVLSE